MELQRDKLMLLAQLIDSMDVAVADLDKAYNKNDKKRFDNSKEALLDFQAKTEFLLKR